MTSATDAVDTTRRRPCEPVPSSTTSIKDQISCGYENQVLLISELTVDAGMAPGTYPLQVEVSGWSASPRASPEAQRRNRPRGVCRGRGGIALCRPVFTLHPTPGRRTGRSGVRSGAALAQRPSKRNLQGGHQTHTDRQWTRWRLGGVALADGDRSPHPTTGCSTTRR